MLNWFYGQKEEPPPDDQMVHRPSDTRLLSNLISHEKDYSKQLQSLLDSSHASLASLSAFAAAHVQPISQVILSVSGDFSVADDALRRYKDAVDAWREQLKTLKDMETDVATIIRDKEILVTRLLKASKNEKPPKDKGNNLSSRRNSALGQRAPSSSSLSLSLEHSYAPSASQPTSNKLAAARAELQACEAHLAEKERELEGARITAIRDGLRIRCNALIECGQAWIDMGRDASHTTETLHVHEGDSLGSKYYREPYLASQQSPHKAVPLHMQAETVSERGHQLSSDFSSIGPSQSASQVNVIIDHSNVANPSVIPNAPNPILGVNGSDIQHGQPSTDTPTIRPSSTPPLPPPIRAPSPFAMPIHRSNSMIHVTHVDTQPPNFEYGKIEVPPAHAIRDGTMPSVTATIKPEPPRRGSGYLTPVSNDAGSRSTLEAPTGCRITRADEDLDVEGDNGEDPDISKEKRLLKEGKLKVVENPRYHQGPSVSDPPVDARPAQERVELPAPPPALPADGPPQEEPNVAGVREIREEAELPEPRVEAPPGVPSSVPAGGPQTPKKRSKRAGSSTPQKSGFLGSLKKVFGRESSMTSEEKARGKEEKAREKELKERERKEKAREREARREERFREEEERREEHQREKDSKAKGKKKGKQARERDRQMKNLMPESSSSSEEELVDENDSMRRYRSSARVSGLLGKGKKGDKWKSRTDRNISDLRKESTDDADDTMFDGYIVRRNTELQRNLRGGVVEAEHTPHQGRGRVRSDAGESLTGAEGGRRLRKGPHTSTGGTFVVERGAKVTRSSSVPPVATYVAPSRVSGERTKAVDRLNGTRTQCAAPLAQPTETRFREELSSPKGRLEPHGGKISGVVKDRDYASDTANFKPSTRIDGMPAGPSTVDPKTGAITLTLVRRKPSEKRDSMPVEGVEVGRHPSVLSSATAPAGMSTGLGGRRGSVGVSVATPRAAVGTGSHRRAVSVDYGHYGPATTAPVAQTSVPRAFGPMVSGGSSVPSQRPQESLMSIVDNVTRSNRHAWDTGLTESKMDRTRVMMRSEVGSKFLGPVTLGNSPKSGGNVSSTAGASGATRSGLGLDFRAGWSSVDGLPRAGNESSGHGGLVKAPPRVDRQSLMSSLKGTPGSPGKSQPATTYTTTRIQVDGTPEKKPLKSAMRSSSPDGPMPFDEAAVGKGYAHGYLTKTGKNRIVPMAVLPSMSSLPVEEQEERDSLPPPVQRVRNVGGNDAEYRSNGADGDDDDDDDDSSSAYETGHEDLDSWSDDRPRRRKSAGRLGGTSAPQSMPRREESIDRRPGLGSPPLAMSSQVASTSAQEASSSQPTQCTPSSTPRRRKSVRVSLNPTFSPTPPAIEDEEDEAGRAPFVFRDVVAPEPVTPTNHGKRARPPVMQVAKGHDTQRTASKDVWEDDSDEDAEYQQAKSMLLKATKREKEVFSKPNRY